MTKIVVLFLSLLFSFYLLADKNGYYLFLQGQIEEAYTSAEKECRLGMENSCNLAALIAYNKRDSLNFDQLVTLAKKSGFGNYFEALALIRKGDEERGLELMKKSCRHGEREACGYFFSMGNYSMIKEGCRAGEAPSCHLAEEDEKACQLGLKESCLLEDRRFHLSIASSMTLLNSNNEKRVFPSVLMSVSYLERSHIDLGVDAAELQANEKQVYSKTYLGGGPLYTRKLFEHTSFKIIPSLGANYISYKAKLQFASKILIGVAYSGLWADYFFGPIYLYEAPTKISTKRVGGSFLGLAFALTF